MEVPIGDFFGMGHAMTRNFVSAPLQMSPEDGQAFNCWFPMPFKKHGQITVENECDTDLILYYYVDYEVVEELPEDVLTFHAQWRRENPTKGKNPKKFS